MDRNDLISRSALKEEVNKKQVVGRFNMLNLIDNAPTVELFCAYLSDGEVRQPCLEAPCKHERPQGEFVKMLNERIAEMVCKWCQMNKHCELCEISRVFMIIALTDEEMKGSAE